MKSLLLSFMQDLREKDGIPDIRRAARFRYASVSPIEVGLIYDNTKKCDKYIYGMP
jgi:hypothetical protein